MSNIKDGLKDVYDTIKPFPDDLSRGFKHRIAKKLKFMFGNMAFGVYLVFMLFLMVVDKKFRAGWEELR